MVLNAGSHFLGFFWPRSDELFPEVHVQHLWNPWLNAFDTIVYFWGVFSVFLKILCLFIEKKGLPGVKCLKVYQDLNHCCNIFRKLSTIFFICIILILGCRWHG